MSESHIHLSETHIHLSRFFKHIFCHTKGNPTFSLHLQVCIDSGCATFAEVSKRGDDFWKEFDLYASDMLVGVVMDVALVSMLAPVARFAPLPSAAAASTNGRSFGIQRFLASLPSRWV